jgi:hypothetical protein
MNREDIIKLAKEAGIGQTGPWFSCIDEGLERFAELVAAVEREACATIIQRAGLPSIADAIRARGKE